LSQSDVIYEIQILAELTGNEVREISTGWTKIDKLIFMKLPMNEMVRRQFMNDPRVKYVVPKYDSHYGDLTWSESFVDEGGGVVISFPRIGSPKGAPKIP